MPCTVSEVSVTDRLLRLERKLRRIRILWVFVAIVVASVALASWRSAPQTPEVVQATEFKVVSSSGEPLASLRVEDGVLVLSLNPPLFGVLSPVAEDLRDTQAQLVLRAGPALELRDGTGQVTARLDGSK